MKMVLVITYHTNKTHTASHASTDFFTAGVDCWTEMLYVHGHSSDVSHSISN